VAGGVHYLVVKSGDLDVIERHAPGAEEFLVFCQLAFLFIAVTHFEQPFLSGFITFDESNKCPRSKHQTEHPFIVDLIHIRFFKIGTYIDKYLRKNAVSRL